MNIILSIFIHKPKDGYFLLAYEKKHENVFMFEASHFLKDMTCGLQKTSLTKLRSTFVILSFYTTCTGTRGSKSYLYYELRLEGRTANSKQKTDDSRSFGVW